MSSTKRFLATASNIASSDIYMTVEMVMFEQDKPNLNGVRCTASFIDEIVTNREKYTGLPLVADVQALSQGKFDKLSHQYDAATDTFGTQIIGSFVDFRKGASEDGTPALIGVARISKRDQETCEAIASLFAQNKLKFSFEIACSTMAQLDDGTVQIDAAEGNYITSLAVVSTPACPSAVAMQLVAETEERKEADAEMNKENEIIESAEAVEVNEEVAEVVETIDVPAEVPAEVEAAEKTEEPKEDSEEEKKDEPEEECAACKKKEAEEDEEEEKPEEECAEVEAPAHVGVSLESLFAEIQALKAAVEVLTAAKAEPVVAEVKETKTVEVAEVNPFTDDMKAENRWSLLEEDEKTNTWTLI